MVIAGVIIGIAVLLFVGFLLLAKPRSYEIPEEEQYIIYQQGLFKRIIGPGPVWVWEGFENIERKINVRNEPKDIVVNDLFVYDIPFGYKLNYWSCFEPTMFERSDPKLMAELVQFDENERHQQVMVKVRDALVNSIVKVQDAQETSPNSLLSKILLIAPGLDGYKSIMQYVRDELSHTLPTIGIRLDPRQPITTTKLYLAPDIVGFLNRDRIFEQIEKTLPNLSSTERMQALSTIDGLTIPPMSSMSSADLAAGNSRFEYDISQGKDGAQVRTRVKPGAPQQPQSAAEPRPSSTENDVEHQPEQDVSEYKLKPSDLKVLKKIA